MNDRIQKDQEEWFPYCLSFSEKLKSIQQTKILDKKQINIHFESEDSIEALLTDLKSIMIKHLSGDYNENLCYAVIFALNSLEKDIKQHNRIRYRILTPIVRAMEELCS